MPKNTSITIKEGTMCIGSYAFDDCTGLTNVTIPSSVTSIGESAFRGCTGLTNVTIPSSVTSIGNSAFSYCTGLASITIPESVTKIGNSAFSYCTGLASIIIPSSVTSIGPNVFYKVNGDVKIFVDKNSFSLLRLWDEIRISFGTSEIHHIDECLYDITTREKIEVVETTASSIKVLNPEPKNYTITSKSLTFGGKSVELPYDVKGLAPNKNMGDIVLTIKYKDNLGEEYTFTAKETAVKTDALTLTTEQPKVVNEGNVIVSATTNVDPEEENVGFEWRREDWSSTFASQSGSAVILDGTMEGYIRNLYTGKLWNYRAYYLSNDGTYYYGDWVGIDPTNTSYFEPTVHTYADISTSGKVALIRGYVLNGTDKIKVQGFKYWKSASKSNSLDIDIEDEPQASAVTVPSNAMTETVDIVGAGQQKMNVTLDDLDYETTYYCVAFATTEENETFYGEVQTFTTDVNPTGIETVRAENSDNGNAEAVGFYTVNGQATNSLQKGLNIIRFSDGTTRKVMVK